MNSVFSRHSHSYAEERVTPLSEIPPEYRMEAKLPDGRIQITDTRLCYNFQPAEEGKPCKLVECGSVCSHAAQEGFFSPERKRI